MLLSRASSLVASSVALLCAGATWPALAADTPAAESLTSEPRVVLVTSTRDSEVATLLQAELNQLGFDVSIVTPEDPEPLPRELTALARELNAVAAFRVSVTSDRLEVWIADRVTGKVTLREVIRREQGEPFSARVAVLRAVELLRWSLQELQAPYPARGEIEAPPPAVQELAEEPQSGRRISFGAAAYGQMLPGNDRLGVGLELSAALRFEAIGGRVLLGQPMLPNRFSSPRGHVDAEATSVGAEVTWDALPLRSRFQVGAALGVRVLSFELTGVVDDPFIGKSSRYYSLAPALHSTFEVRLFPGLSAFADASLLYLAGETRVSLAGESVATLGNGVATLGAGLLLVGD